MEESGLPKSNKRTFTNGKKQKVVLNESQLQRLIGLINEKTTKDLKEQQPIGYVCHHGACTGVHIGSFQYASMQACLDAGCGTLGSPVQGGTVSAGDEQMSDAPATSPAKPQTSPVRKKCCKCRGQKPYSLPSGKRCPKSCPEVNCKGTPPTQGNITTENKKRLKEQGMYYQCIDGTCTPAFMPNPTLPQFNTLQDCQNSECGEANQGGEMDRDMEMGRDMEMNKQEGRYDTPDNMKACKAAGGNESLCSRHLRAGTMPPKPSGTPQGKWILGGFFCCAFGWKCCEDSPIDRMKDIFFENRTLKTTNPITESEIKDMKKWFNRIDKSGRNYNPSRT